MKYIVGIIIVAVLMWGAFNVFKGGAPSPTDEGATKKESVAGETSTEGKIKIGFMGPLTGDASTYGESIKRGVDLAWKQWRQDNVEIIYEDSKCEAKEAATAANKLISLDHVVAIIGEACSSATLAAAPVANENKVILISPASTSPELTDAGEFVFRTIPSDALQGYFAAKLVYDKGYRKLAVFYIKKAEDGYNHSSQNISQYYRLSQQADDYPENGDYQKNYCQVK